MTRDGNIPMLSLEYEYEIMDLMELQIYGTRVMNANNSLQMGPIPRFRH
jgi:hypothetical protein